MSLDCAVCFNSISAQDRYVCPETNRGQNAGKPHMSVHLKCAQEWAKTKGAPDAKVMCFEPGCNTDISHLGPKPGYFSRAVSFLEKRPSITILASGLAALGTSYVYKSGDQLQACLHLLIGWSLLPFVDNLCGKRVRVVAGVPAGIVAVIAGVALKSFDTGSVTDMLACAALPLIPVTLTAMAAAPSVQIAEVKAVAFMATSVMMGISVRMNYPFTE